MKYDFSGVSEAFGIPYSQPVTIDQTYENVYAVESITVYKNVVFVKGDCATDSNDHFLDNCCFFQRHVSDNRISCTPVKSDSDFVKILQETEQPNITLESFTNSKKEWLENILDLTNED